MEGASRAFVMNISGGVDIERMIAVETVSEARISLWTNGGSCCELDRCLIDAKELLGFPVPMHTMWFTRLKARREGEGEGSLLMRRLVEILDERSWAVINAVNPYGRMDMDTLCAFYAKYGFDTVRGELMIRWPHSRNESK